ncbi:MAG: multidrug effflux MFS transporter [Pseudomonas sp.]|nr:multidrug effflux MFS transporter [Pseudomonas sp.]MDD2223404.1 multidrug effflux MFS transporter [Pseudomonas sp.]MDY0414062.1 multidrug effflux MFS transporter [Pseudomonas sp.]
MQLIILLASLSALVAAAIDMYLPAFPTIATSLAITPGQVQQTLTIFLIGLGIGQGLYGPLLDRFGRKPPLLIGIGLFTLGSLFAALTTSFEGLLVARFLQAIGAAAGAVASRAIVTDTCDPQSSARIYSMLMQVMMIAPITAPMLGGLILLYGEWHLIFWVLALLGIICGFFTIRLLPETLAVERRVPLSARSMLRNYAIQLSNPSFVFYTLATSCTLGCLFIYINNSPFIFIEMFKLTPNQFSYIFAANALTMIAISQINLRLLKFYSAMRILLIGLGGFISIGLVLLGLLQVGWTALWSYSILLGLGMAMSGLITGNLTAVTMAHTQQHAGIASSLMGLIQFLLAATIGFLASIAAPPSLHTMPIALLVFGVAAMGLCLIGRRFAQQATPDP